MTKIDIFSGFLGAGKTTLIKKLIAEAFAGEKLVLIENEFGDIAIDGGFLQDSGIVVNEMNSEKQFVVLAHPIWSRMEPEEVRSLSGLDAIEVFNTGTERLCHAGRADVYWDMLLREGKRVYAIACDDTHGKTAKGDRFGGWIMVNAESLTQEALLSAIRSGNFYASCGPELYDVSIQDGILHVSCSACSEIHVISYPPRGKAHYAEGEMLTELNYPLKGGESYIRVECVDADGKPAWSNAIFLNP